MKLYHCTRSRSTRIRWLLEELALPYELVELPFPPSGPLKDELQRINPLGRIPTLVDGDLVLIESGAMVQHILERHAGGRLQPPADSPERGEFLNWMHYAEGSLMVPVGVLVRQLLFTPEDQRNIEQIRDARAQCLRLLQPIEQALAGRQYLLGEFSGADCMLGYSVHLTDLLKVVDDTMPNVQAYLERIRQRGAWEKAMTPTV